MGRRLRIGSAAAEFASLVFDEHSGFVWRTLGHLGVDEASVDDALQDVFVTAFRRAGDFEGRSSERTWLFGIARRVAFRYRRAAQTRQRHVVTVSGTDVTRVQGAVEPHRRADARQSINALVGALDRDKRTVFVLCELEGMTAAEVAEVLSLPLGTVHSRRRAAWQRLSAAAERERVALRDEVARLAAQEPDGDRRDRVRAALLVSLGTAASHAVTWAVVAAAAVLSLVALRFAVDSDPSTVPTPTQPVATTSEPEGPSPSIPRSTEAAVPAAVVPAPAGLAPGATPSAPRTGRPTTATATPTTPTPPPASEPAAPTGSDALTLELELLQRARAQVAAGRFSAASQALQEHARQFGDGQLAGERDALRVDVLCATGQTSAAETLAATLRGAPTDPCAAKRPRARP